MLVTILRNRASRSGRALANALGVGVAYADSVRHTRGDRFVINWGVSSTPVNFAQRRLTYSNFPAAVGACANKIVTLQLLAAHSVPCLEFYTSTVDDARERVGGWLATDGKVVARHTVTGHSGEGIEIIREPPIRYAPLYTRYFRKQAEYRCHVFYGRVLLIQQKKRMNEDRRPEGSSSLVRTHSNGWVFATNDLSCDTRGYREELEKLALDGATAVGINHGAVDILVNHETGARVVCEINSAPALEATATLEVWRAAFQQKISEM